MSIIIEAQRSGPCFSCDRGIRPGQKIRLNETPGEGGPDGEWEHYACPPAPVVCGECFTEVTRSGSCMCGDES